jgi:ABC-2 type transport system ATP-binding protein
MPTDKNNDVVVRTVALTKVFRDFWLREKVAAVQSLDLNIRPGEVYGLLGPNGSGKSTTLKMILGLLYPTRGRVTVFGASPSDVRTKARIGFLPEESYLYPFLDANETLDYYGRLFGQPRRERKRRIGMLLDMVGLTGSAYRRIGEYSKGMQRRIGMAQALINDPDLLILDEPTSGMDPLAARQFKDLIKELSQRGKTLILSSHLLADTEDVCDRVGILFAGQLRTEGTLEDLLSKASLTQIVTERLDDATRDAVRRVLDKSDTQVISIESPKDKLEALFLRIVRQAQTRHRTVDSVKTGEVAEFLRASSEETGRKVIEKLLAGPEAATPVTDQPPPSPLPDQPKTDSGVIAELTSGAEEAKSPPLRSETTPPPPKIERRTDETVDRNVIDELTRNGGLEDH